MAKKKLSLSDLANLKAQVIEEKVIKEKVIEEKVIEESNPRYGVGKRWNAAYRMQMFFVFPIEELDFLNRVGTLKSDTDLRFASKDEAEKRAEELNKPLLRTFNFVKKEGIDLIPSDSVDYVSYSDTSGVSTSLESDGFWKK